MGSESCGETRIPAAHKSATALEAPAPPRNAWAHSLNGRPSSLRLVRSLSDFYDRVDISQTKIRLAGRKGLMIADRAWLALAVKGRRQHGGNDGYSDRPEVSYEWDTTVPNHARVEAGDLIAIWDKTTLLGASVIERVKTGTTVKPIYRCPNCERAGIKARDRRTPKYKCYKCKSEFETPTTRWEEVGTYQSQHGAAWVDLHGELTGAELRALCVAPRSQLSLRPLQWVSFLAELPGTLGARVRTGKRTCPKAR
jgi:hypothetical protein